MFALRRSRFSGSSILVRAGPAAMKCISKQLDIRFFRNRIVGRNPTLLDPIFQKTVMGKNDACSGGSLAVETAVAPTDLKPAALFLP